MKQIALVLVFLPLTLPRAIQAQEYLDGGRVKVAIVRNPFMASESILAEGLIDSVKALDATIAQNQTFDLTEMERTYSGWAREALVSRHLADLISVNGKNEYLTVALLGSCSDLPGVLSGLQNMGPGQEEQTYHLAANIPHRVGLIYFDAHADVNTPETTLSGMYGGMDVALSAGLYNDNNRLITGLDPPLPPSYILLGDVRDTDPREKELIDRLHFEILSTDDIRTLSRNVHAQMERLSSLTDVIYVHIDMDVLAPEEVLGHGLTAPDGPTSQELADCLELIFRYPKATAIGIASTPYGPRDPDHLSRQAAVRLIQGALRGVKGRK
ncbi:MAG: arginase family protein [Thermoplasmata archaeon]|nr:arginase family protein [Thermoplasmata archaeon]